MPRSTRVLPSASRPVTERWWQVLLVGGIVLATTIIVASVVGEVSSDLWLPMMLTLLVGVVTTAVGVILGTVHLIENRPPRAG